MPKGEWGTFCGDQKQTGESRVALLLLAAAAVDTAEWRNALQLALKHGDMDPSNLVFFDGHGLQADPANEIPVLGEKSYLVIPHHGAAPAVTPEAGVTEEGVRTSPSAKEASVPADYSWSIVPSSWTDALIGPLRETVYEPALEELKLEYHEARECSGDSPELFQIYRRKVQFLRVQTLYRRVAGPVENLFERLRTFFDHVRSVLLG